MALESVKKSNSSTFDLQTQIQGLSRTIQGLSRPWKSGKKIQGLSRTRKSPVEINTILPMSLTSQSPMPVLYMLLIVNDRPLFGPPKQLKTYSASTLDVGPYAHNVPGAVAVRSKWISKLVPKNVESTAHTRYIAWNNVYVKASHAAIAIISRPQLHLLIKCK